MKLNIIILLFSYLFKNIVSTCTANTTEVQNIYNYLTSTNFSISLTTISSTNYTATLNFALDASPVLSDPSSLLFGLYLGNSSNTNGVSDTIENWNTSSPYVVIDVTSGTAPTGCTKSGNNYTCTLAVYAYNNQTSCPKIIYAQQNVSFQLNETNQVTFTFNNVDADEITFNQNNFTINLSYVLAAKICTVSPIPTNWEEEWTTCSSQTNNTATATATYSLNDILYAKFVILNATGGADLTSTKKLDYVSGTFTINNQNVSLPETQLINHSTDYTQIAFPLIVTNNVFNVAGELNATLTVVFTVLDRIRLLRQLQDGLAVNTAEIKLKITKPSENQDGETTEAADSSLVIIIVCVVVGVLILAIILYCVCFRGKGKNSDDGDKVDVELSQRSGQSLGKSYGV